MAYFVTELVWSSWFVAELVRPRCLPCGRDGVAEFVQPRWSTSVADLVCGRDGCDPVKHNQKTYYEHRPWP